MFRNRLFNVFVAIALVIVVTLTIREAAATAGVTSQTSSTTTGARAVDCVSLPSRYSLRTEYVKEADMWIVRTEDGPTGLDGGLIELLSNYRTCSR